MELTVVSVTKFSSNFDEPIDTFPVLKRAYIEEFERLGEITPMRDIEVLIDHIRNNGDTIGRETKFHILLFYVWR
ncbi:hypothetical protein GCM10009647_056950 [Streptomyces sanglieri]